MANFLILNRKINKKYKTRLIKCDFRNLDDTNGIDETANINFAMADNPNYDIDSKYEFLQCKIIDTITKHHTST